MENPTINKRTNIIIGFVVLFGVLGYIFFYLTAPAPTCFDKKQNQAEKGIDCGGTCAPCQAAQQAQDIVIKEVAVALGGNDTYDVAAKIVNPNNTLGSASFNYTFELKDSSGNVISTREGNSFILPADSKYIGELGLNFDKGSVPASVDLVIGEVKWEELKNIGKPQIGVYNKNVGEDAATKGIEADGVIRNESGYDLGKISVVVILRSESGDIVGIHKTEKNSVRIKEERDFRLTWPYQLSAPVQNIEVDAQSNAFKL
jgi:hypothetical protein